MVKTTLSENGRSLTISIVGKFDFSIQQQFRVAYEDSSAKPLTYVIDLRQADYMDSAALGMLLLLREYAGNGRVPVHITNAKPQILKVLEIAGFKELFKF